MATPNQLPKGPTLRESAERQQLSIQAEQVDWSLRLAANYEGGTVRERWISNPERRAMIAAVPVTYADGRTRYLPRGSEQLRSLVRPEYVFSKDQMFEIRKALAAKALGVQREIKKIVTKLEKNQEEMGTQLPSQTRELLSELRGGLQEDIDASLAAHAVAWDAALDEVENSVRRNLTVEQCRGLLDDELRSLDSIKMLDGTMLVDRALAEQLHAAINQYYIASFQENFLSPIATDVLEGIQADVNSARTTVEQARRRYHSVHAEERNRFLALMGGTSAELLIQTAKVDPDQPDSPIDLLLLAEFVHAVTQAEVDLEALKTEAGAGTSDEVVLNEANAEKLAHYLQRTYEIHNPAGISIPQLLQRAEYPQEFLQEFSKVADQEIPIGMIGKLAKLADGKPEYFTHPLPEKTKNELFLLVTIPHTEQPSGTVRYQVKPDAFVDVAIALSLPGTGELTDAVLKDIRDRAEQSVQDVVKSGQTIDGITFVDRPQIEAALQAVVSGGQMETFITQLKTTSDAFPLSVRLKMKGSELAGTAVYAGSVWWDSIQTLPSLFTSDPQLLEILNRRRALDRTLDAVGSVLRIPSTSTAAVDRAVRTIARRTDARREALEEVPAAAMPREHYRAAADLLTISDELFVTLDAQHSLDRHPLEVQRTAYWLALHKGVEAAGAFLRHTESERNTYLASLTPEEALLLKQYRSQLTINEHLSGRDILHDMKAEIGVDVTPAALMVLSETKGVDGLLLSVGPSRIDNWDTDPPAAEPALRAILVSAGGDQANVDALIRCFTTGNRTTITRYTLDGKPIPDQILQPAEARAYILKVRNYLRWQSDSLQRSAEQAARRNRFTTPLDVMRGGSKAIADMIRSGDKVQMALAFGLIAATSYGLVKAWKHGGWKTKGLLLGIPLFFGADIALERMTGAGILSRLGLRFQNKEERNTAYEQFLRRNEARSDYAFLKKEGGKEAARLLMDQKCPLPVKNLLIWRENIRAHGAKSYSLNPPPELETMASQVMRVMGTVDTQGMTSAAKRERAFEYLYKAFDAACADVAEGNAIVSRDSNEGAKIMWNRYVSFTDPRYTPEIAEALRQHDRQSGGFNMLQILTFERQPIDDPYYLEYVSQMTGVAVDKLQGGIRAGLTVAQITAQEGWERAPEWAAEGWDWTKEKGEDIYDWMRTVASKGGARISDEMAASWRLLSGTLSAAGVYITRDGPRVAEWVYDQSADFIGGTVDALQNLYRVLQNNGVSGQALDFVDRNLQSLTGYTMSEFLLYEATLTDANTEKQVEELARYAKWMPEFMDQMRLVSDPPPTEEQIVGWIQRAGHALDLQLTINRMADPDEITAMHLDGTPANAFEVMAAMERVKRRVFSFLIARRVVECERIAEDPSGTVSLTYPLPIVEWKDWDNLLTDQKYAEDIEKAYGLPMLALLGSEPTVVFGNVERIIQGMEDGTMRDTAEIAFGAVDWIGKDEALHYMAAVNEYHRYFMKQAEDALPDGPEKEEKLKQYDAFLQTLLTNAVIDKTLRQQEARSGLPGDAIDVEEGHADPLALTIRQAKDFLDFLRTTRGMSASYDHVDTIKLDAFAIEGETPALRSVFRDEELMGHIRALRPESKPPTPTPPGAPGALPPVPANFDALLAQPDVPLGALKEALGTAMTPEQRLALESKFNEAARVAEATDLKQKANRDKAFTAMEGASASAAEQLGKKMLQDNIADLMPVIIEAAEKRDDPTTKNARPMQRLIEKGAVLQTHKLLKEISTVPIDALPSHSKRGEWESHLRVLYKASYKDTPNSVSDAVSQMLEYVLYQVKHNQTPDAQGKKGFAKYEAYLRSHGLVPPPEETYRYGSAGNWFTNRWNSYDGSKERMKKSHNVSSGYLTARGWSPEKRLEALEKDYQLEDLARMIP